MFSARSHQKQRHMQTQGGEWIKIHCVEAKIAAIMVSDKAGFREGEMIMDKERILHDDEANYPKRHNP